MGGAPVPAELANRLMARPMTQAMPWMTDALVTDVAIAGAAAVLTPTQLAALKVLQAQQVAELQVLPPRSAKDMDRKTK